jgi:predicted O-linked N-acetylglucosamine transferase (SPINDLY family)
MHDRSKFEIHAFSYSNTKDEVTARIVAGVDIFHDVSKMFDNDVVLLSRKLEIDIAVDLGGYTQNGRTEIFAMRAAPVQMSYIGYLGTMAANYFDYLIADPIIIPEENKKYYSEKIIYLPSYQVNDSKKVLPTNAVTRQEFGLPEKGFVFCCFNNAYKINPNTLDSWVRIFKRVDGSVLFVYVENESAENNLRKEVILRGLEANRLILGKRLDVQEYLARYRAADLFLDTLPYNAGTTASDALRMGLPVLTCMGKSFASRMAASLLTNLNLPELVTASREDYENLAVELATNSEKLRIIKDKLLANLTTAPLYNTKLFTKNIESAYNSVFERYKNGLNPDHIYVKSLPS